MGPITERFSIREFATTEEVSFGLGSCKLDGIEDCTLVGTVTERLSLRSTTVAEVVGVSLLEVDFIRAAFGTNSLVWRMVHFYGDLMKIINLNL